MYKVLINLQNSCSLRIDIKETESLCRLFKDDQTTYDFIIPNSAAHKLITEIDIENISVLNSEFMDTNFQESLAYKQ